MLIHWAILAGPQVIFKRSVKWQQDRWDGTERVIGGLAFEAVEIFQVRWQGLVFFVSLGKSTLFHHCSPVSYTYLLFLQVSDKMSVLGVLKQGTWRLIYLFWKTDHLICIKKGNYMCLKSSLLKFPPGINIMLIVMKLNLGNRDSLYYSFYF